MSCAFVKGYSQDCEFTIKGYVYDQGTEDPLSYVNVFIQEISKGSVTDDDGNFLIENICEGEYHLIFSHIGCESKKVHFDVLSDTIINVSLPHTSTAFSTVVIEGVKDETNNQPSLSVNRQTLEDNINQNLSGLLENETGVNLIKNGSSISKPVVHGLYGNRLTILNNGIVQSGQQWGNDHSPEIDPFAADKIVVLKGASAIEYAAGNLGSIILVEPKKIEREPHVHGQVNYFYESNGRGHGLNTRVEKYSPELAWRVNGTFKKYGDRKTADYFLNNTGFGEFNLALQLEKTIDEELFLEFYASTFNTSLGILRGSHIGNLTDLNQALINEVPFFTEDNFSYDVDAPRQNVSHHLVKGKAKYYITENQNIEFVIASQLNNRQEFDIRRNDRSDIPALNLRQYSTNVDLKYNLNFDNDLTIKLGTQNIYTDNVNLPETGILPLIPDYISFKSGLFATLAKKIDKVQFNVGLRYDLEIQNVATISNSIPREIVRFNNRFNNIGALAALKYNISKEQSISFNSGFAMRNPGINELYSNGLHQGVSGIEEGDINLNTEQAFKNTLEYIWNPSEKFSLNSLVYFQNIQDYIFLNPQDEIRLTIRGAFPVFKYEQTNANIYGFDLSTQFTLGNALLGKLKYSFIQGTDTTNDIPLVFIPSNRFISSLVYRSKKTMKLSEHVLLEDSEIEINNRVVFEQTNLLPQQDFTPPPPTYALWGFKVSTNALFTNYKIRCFVKADNLFNIQYRDYLNRQRYFADDLGISITTGLSFKF